MQNKLKYSFKEEEIEYIQQAEDIMSLKLQDYEKQQNRNFRNKKRFLLK